MALTLIPAFLVSVIMERSRREQHQVAIGEAQFRGAMEFSAIGMALVSLEGRLFKVNEALCRMLGYSAERLGELSFQEITYVDDLELDLDLVRDLLAGRINSYQMEKRYLRQDGETFWARISVSLVRDEEGVAQYFVTQVEDIDSRKRAELERERLAERIKLATDAGQIGIWEWDLARNRLHWDFRMFDLYGIRSGPGETTVEQWKASLHAEDHDRVLRELERAVSGLQKFDCEFRIVRPNREVRHLRAIATLTRDEDNRPVRMIGINSDITEIRTLAETLHEEKERLQVTLYSIGDAVLTTDAGGRVTFMNPVAEAMTGWTLQDAIGAPHELVFNVLDSDTGEAWKARRSLPAEHPGVLPGGRRHADQPQGRAARYPELRGAGAHPRWRDHRHRAGVPERHQGPGDAARAELSRLPRCPHRAVQPHQVRGGAATRPGQRPGAGDPACAVLHRPRPLQGGQRFRRARGGRHAARAEPDSRRPHPRLRHPGAAGRR